MARNTRKRNKPRRRARTKKQIKMEHEHKKHKPLPLRCAPGRQHKFTCYNSESLHELKQAWNKKYPNKKI